MTKDIELSWDQGQFIGDDVAVYESLDSDISVQVTPIFIDDESDAEDSKYIWAYQIRIENTGDQPVQLLARHWEIMNASGATQIIDGKGVIGECPVLKPLEAFEYTSSVILDTPSGFMKGHYAMRKMMSREKIQVTIPPFSLDSHYAYCTVH